MAETTDRYALPLLQVAQAQKEVTHNDAVAAIDMLLHLAVETASATAPPALPLPGQAWIVAAGATGAWAGRDTQVACFGTGGWRYVVPQQGLAGWLRDLQRFAVFTGTGWRSDGWPAAAVAIGARLVLGGGAPAIGVPAGGTVIDVQARAALAAVIAGLAANGLVS